MRQGQYAIENGGGIMHNFLKELFEFKKMQKSKTQQKAWGITLQKPFKEQSKKTNRKQERQANKELIQEIQYPNKRISRERKYTMEQRRSTKNNPQHVPRTEGHEFADGGA